jgi:[ribosomal protein S18]-alanine N-acetyltransferase
MTALGPVAINHVSIDELPLIEAIMDRAFDPAFGEAWSPAQCLAVLTMPGYAVRIASIADVIHGFSIIRWVLDESELLLLAVVPDARGRGIGTALIDDWLDVGRAEGASRFFLEMRTDNPAHRLYDAMGFSVSGRRPDYYRGRDGELRDAVTMQRICG